MVVHGLRVVLQRGFVLVLLLSDLLQEHDSVAVLVVGLRLLSLLLLLRLTVEFADLAPQLLQVVLVFVITLGVQSLTSSFHLRLDGRYLLGDDGLDHEEHLAEADSVLEDRDQILVLLGHVADLLAQLLLSGV